MWDFYGLTGKMVLCGGIFRRQICTTLGFLIIIPVVKLPKSIWCVYKCVYYCEQDCPVTYHFVCFKEPFSKKQIV